MRSRKLTCPACGTSNPDQPDSDSDSAQSRWRSFLESATGEWPGWSDPLCELPGVGQQSTPRADKRIRVEELRERTRVIDTRPAAEYGIASVEGSVSESRFRRLAKSLDQKTADRPRLSSRHPVPAPAQGPFPRPRFLGRGSTSPRPDHVHLPPRERLSPRFSSSPAVPRGARPPKGEHDRGGRRRRRPECLGPPRRRGVPHLLNRRALI